MTLKQMTANLWIQELDLGIFEVRGALLIGEHRAVIWDTLSHPRDMGPYSPLIPNKDVFIVYSHADWDHIWGTAGFLATPATIIGHTVCRDRFQSDVPETLREKQQAEPEKWDDVALIPPNITFQDELLIDLGGLTVELHHLPGHSADCLIAIVPEQGIALMGDTIETPFPVVYPESPVPEWIERLQRWAQDTRITTVIPSHGPIGGPELITQTIDYLERLRDGREIAVPESMTEFYRETHEGNLGWRAANGF